MYKASNRRTSQRASTSTSTSAPGPAAGPSNAQLAAELPTGDPEAGSLLDDLGTCSDPSGELQALVAGGSPEAPPSIGELVTWFGTLSLEDQIALHQDLGLWVAPFWEEAGLSGPEVRPRLDPLEGVVRTLRGVRPSERHAVLVQVHTQVPSLASRLSTDPSVRDALLDGAEGPERLALLSLLVQGEAAFDAYLDLAQAVTRGDVQEIEVAWPELLDTPDLALRFARDLRLRQQIRDLDAGLADYVERSVATLLAGELTEDEQDLLDDIAMPTLQALEPVQRGPTAFQRAFGSTVGADAKAAVDTYLTRVKVRHDADQLLVPLDVADQPIEVRAGQRLRQLFADFNGMALIDAIAAHDREAAAAVATAIGGNLTADPSGPVTAAPGGDVASWDEVGHAAARRQATALHRAVEADAAAWLGGGGGELLPTVTHAEAELRAQATEHAKTGSAEGPPDAQATENRVREAMGWLRQAYEDRYGPLSAVLGAVDDPMSRRRIAQKLGLEADAIGKATHGLLDGTDADADRRALMEEVAVLGRELGEAVGQRPNRALRVAEGFDELQRGAVRAGTIQLGERSILLTALEAGAASVVGNLRHAIARLDNADKVFDKLGLESTALALKAADDERNDAAVKADYGINVELDDAFEALTRGKGEVAFERMNAAKAHATTLHTEDPATAKAHATPGLLLTARYRDTFGIALDKHVADAPITRVYKGYLRKLLPQSAKLLVPTDEEQEAKRGELADRLQSSFFTMVGLQRAADPAGQDARIAEAVEAHVAELHALTESPTMANLRDEETDLLVYQSRLALTGGHELVADAYATTHGRTLAFAIHQARALGGIDETTANTALRFVEKGQTSRLAGLLRANAEADRWQVLLERVLGASMEDRASVLNDGDTVAYLADAAPTETVWDAVHRGLRGELRTDELLDLDVSTDTTLEAGGEAIKQSKGGLGRVMSLIGHNSGLVPLDAIVAFNRFDAATDALFGWDSDDLVDAALSNEETADAHTLIAAKAKGEGASGDALHAATILEHGVQTELTDAHGTHTDARRKAEGELFDGKKDTGRVKSEVADNDLFELDNQAAAIDAMSDEERKAALADPLFLDTLDRLTANDPTAWEELMTKLQRGKEDAGVARIEAEGTGATPGWFKGDPWGAIEALSTMPTRQITAIAVDAEERGRWEAAVSDSSEASGTFLRMMVDAQHGAEGLEGEGRDDPATSLFVEQQLARIRVAAQGGEQEMVEALLDVDKAFAAARSTEGGSSEAGSDEATEPAQPAWVPQHARTAVRREGAPLIEGWAEGSIGLDAVDGYDFGRLLDAAVLGDGSVGPLVVQRRGVGEQRTVLLAAVEQATDDTVATAWSSLIVPGVGGLPPLIDAVEAYRAADAAWFAAAEAEQDALLEAKQAARDRLATHPVDLAANALDLAIEDRKLHHGGVADSVDDLDEGLATALREAIYQRIQGLDAKTVHQVLGVTDPEEARIVWSKTHQATVLSASSSEALDAGLSEASVVVSVVSDEDDQAARAGAAFAQSMQTSWEGDGTVTEDELAQAKELAKQMGVDLKQWKAARKAAADTASWTATLAIGTAVTLASGGVGSAPFLAGLLSSAATGAAEVAIREAVLGQDYDAEDGMKTLLVNLASEAVTGGLGDAWTVAKGSLQAAAKRGGVEFLFTAETILAEAAQSMLGEGVAYQVGAAAAKVPRDALKDFAWESLDPELYRNGWEEGTLKARAALEAKLSSLGEEEVDAILAALAKELGKAIVPDLDEEDYGVGRPAGQEPGAVKAKDANDYRDRFSTLLGARAQKVARSSARKTVTEGASVAAEKGKQQVLTGDAELSASEVVDFTTTQATAAATELGNGIGTDAWAADEAYDEEALHNTLDERQLAFERAHGDDAFISLGYGVTPDQAVEQYLSWVLSDPLKAEERSKTSVQTFLAKRSKTQSDREAKARKAREADAHRDAGDHQLASR